MTKSRFLIGVEDALQEQFKDRPIRTGTPVQRSRSRISWFPEEAAVAAAAVLQELAGGDSERWIIPGSEAEGEGELSCQVCP
mmetsp:Transcript_83473/g.183476  ORF Transcript_83473/g.183476 Transcript_83473/m.183476 type:complete len:82 (+) Transcript_83473:1577-1822(+)